MDKIIKALRRLSPKERASLKGLLQKIEKRNFAGLDIKKLRSHDSIYRVRKGDLRIIFSANDESVQLLAIERRSTTTYNRF
jgi:mRNA-degrading endonuclease RelE of RelBE toxin-antitoxin system